MYSFSAAGFLCRPAAWSVILGTAVALLSLTTLPATGGEQSDTKGQAPAPKTQGKAEIKASNSVGRPVRRNIFVNQVGYLPRGAKYFVVEDSTGTLPESFSVTDVNRQTDPNRFSGKLSRFAGDFGTYYVGEFSELATPGKYIISLAGGFTSYTFRIAPDVYADALAKGINCFAVQRCGPSKTGYNAPCHLDDGRTKDGKHVDLVGGWHDASDLLKWASATITGMHGLLNVSNLSDDDKLCSRIFEEVQWGNIYFLKLQSPDGYIYSYGIGGDPVEQGNHWTDNVRGTADDRPAVLSVGPISLQHQFIAAQGLLVSVYGERDRTYADRCLQAARRCFNWVKDKKPSVYSDIGSGIYAGVQMYRATGDEQYKAYALRMANAFLTLQEVDYVGEQQKVRGYFYADERRKQAAEIIHTQPLAFIGLCELAEAFPKHADAPRWRQAIELHSRDYLAAIASRNAFGIVPYVIQPQPKLVEGARRVGVLPYRYFMGPRNGRWWVGNNANLAGAGIALVKAARILKRPELARLAQRQLDWILGANPFGVSTMVGVGHVNPPEYIFTGFQPRTPRIPGAVMCGIAGDEDDQPDLQPGAYHTCEYWTPMLAHLIWLLAEMPDCGLADS